MAKGAPLFLIEPRSLMAAIADLQHCAAQLQAGQWVPLAASVPFESAEALLLCRQCNGQWIAWIPDYGEVSLWPIELDCHPSE
ncbi:hypothetical protein [Almyronema epifaneia]|uniref:DUF1830 domain-containing protein n=1 Tax=Almyronema epifaneia S1 TaxID=2991925 RepID=A0ABW6IBG5_9CYAN